MAVYPEGCFSTARNSATDRQKTPKIGRLFKGEKIEILDPTLYQRAIDAVCYTIDAVFIGGTGLLYTI